MSRDADITRATDVTSPTPRSDERPFAQLERDRAALRAAVGVTPEAALAELADARLSLVEAYRVAAPAALDGASYPHPHLGPLTVRARVELIAHHDARHATQVEALAAHAPGRP